MPKVTQITNCLKSNLNTRPLTHPLALFPPCLPLAESQRLCCLIILPMTQLNKGRQRWPSDRSAAATNLGTGVTHWMTSESPPHGLKSRKMRFDGDPEEINHLPPGSTQCSWSGAFQRHRSQHHACHLGHNIQQQGGLGSTCTAPTWTVLCVLLQATLEAEQQLAQELPEGGSRTTS